MGERRDINRRGFWAWGGVLALLVSAAAWPGQAAVAQPGRVQSSRLVSASQAAGTISTIAGGVGGPATARSVALGEPCGVSFGNGQLYVAAGSAVRQVDPGNDWLITPAGTGVSLGVAGDGTPADDAAIDTCAIAIDHSGNLVMVNGGERVQVVAAATGTFYGVAMTAGDLYTVAGDGTAGYSGDGGPAADAQLRAALGVTVDPEGNLVVADSANSRVRVVAASTGTFYGQAMTAGDIYTVAGDGTYGSSGDGGPALGAELAEPDGVAVDGAGNLLITDARGNRVQVVAATTGTFYGQAMTAGDIYTVAGNGTLGFSGDGGPAASAELSQPGGIHVDGAGNVLIADSGNARVRVVAATTGTFYGQAMTAGDIYTVAGDGSRGFSGDGGSATAASLYGPTAVTEDGAGNLVIADGRNGRVRVVAASTGMFYGQAMTAGDIYTVAGNGSGGYSGDGGPATSAELSLWETGFPDGMALDHAGNLVIVDQGNGVVRVVAATSGTFYGQAMTAGDIYTVAGDGTAGVGTDGGPATSSKLWLPMGLAIDKAGNLIIADSGNNRVRVVAASSGTFYRQKMITGDIYTLAGDGREGSSGNGGLATRAELDQPAGVAVDHAGNLLVAEWGSNRVQVVASTTGKFYGRKMTRGHIYTVAGTGTGGYAGTRGPATKAELLGPSGVAVDRTGNLVIADWYNDRLRVVAARSGTYYGRKMTAGDIYTVAGDGDGGYSGNGGRATRAAVGPESVTIDSAGNLVLADTFNNRVRVVAVRSGTFYGLKMIAGRIYTVAGNGTAGFAGDGGSPTEAELWRPAGVLVTRAGNLLIADQDNNRIRIVTG
jgi:sugar lactone lactonase YvrE